MGKIAKNYVYNLIYQLFVMLVPLVTAPYLARVLGPEGTGIYSYVYSMTAMICSFVMLGIFNYGNRQIAYVRDDPNKLSEVFWQIMSARLVISIIGSFVYFGIVLLIGKYSNLFVLYYTYMLAYFVDCTWLYVGVEDMKWAVIKNTVTKIIAVVGIFALVHDQDDLPLYVFIQGASILISNLLAYSPLKNYVKHPHLDFSSLNKDIKGAIMLFLPSIASTIYTQCDKVMIELMTGATQDVSFYDYSEKIVTIPLTFITVLSTVMMPRIANEYRKGNNDNISKLLNSAAQFSMFIAFPMALGLIAVADKLIPWYLGNDFQPTVYAIYMISPIIITNTLTGISGSQYFTATNQIGILTKSQFAAVLANIIINATLIPQFGFYGAAAATLITSFACAFVQYFFMLRQIRIPGLFKSISRYLGISIIMFVIIRITTGDMLASPFTNMLQIMIGGIVYLGICFLIKDPQIITFVRKVKNIIRK